MQSVSTVTIEEEYYAYIFRTLTDAREITEKWMEDYNECRPHHSLGDMSPNEYRRKYETDN
jgi:hypothetical protein